MIQGGHTSTTIIYNVKIDFERGKRTSSRFRITEKNQIYRRRYDGGNYIHEFTQKFYSFWKFDWEKIQNTISYVSKAAYNVRYCMRKEWEAIAPKIRTIAKWSTCPTERSTTCGS